MPVRLSAEESFQRAERMRADWEGKKYPSYSALSRAYGVTVVYARNVVLGLKCVRIDPPGKEGKDWKYISLEGIKHALYKDGRLWSCSTNSFKEIKPNQDGYKTFRLTRKDGQGNRKYSIHRLVLTYFDRPPKPGEQARHKDDNPSNNHIKNLRWGYQEDNANDMLRNGGVAVGMQASQVKLTEKQVVRIVKAFEKQSLPAKTFARQYIAEKGLDISVTTICSILRGASWSHLTGIRSDEVPQQRNDVSKKVVESIHRNYEKTGGCKETFSQAFAKFLRKHGYNIGWKTVMKILNKQMWIKP